MAYPNFRPDFGYFRSTRFRLTPRHHDTNSDIYCTHQHTTHNNCARTRVRPDDASFMDPHWIPRALHLSPLFVSVNGFTNAPSDLRTLLATKVLRQSSKKTTQHNSNTIPRNPSFPRTPKIKRTLHFECRLVFSLASSQKYRNNHTQQHNREERPQGRGTRTKVRKAEPGTDGQ